MYYGRTQTRRSLANVNQYLIKEILDASPEKLILKVYDFALIQVQKRNLEKANKAIQELINGLDFSTPETSEIAIGLLKLYKFCQEKMRSKEYDIVYRILSELRDTWNEAISNYQRKKE
jgi:flagellin-specific chaperone FliS